MNLMGEEYDLVKLIGRGKYGEVWQALHKHSKKLFAVKKVEISGQSAEERGKLESEAELLIRLCHPNIVTCHGFYEIPGDALCIVMQYCDGGDLSSRLQQQQGELIHENQIMEWFIQISMAIQYLHEKHILHRDLKTQNVFLTQKKYVKLGDFGIARSLKNGYDMAETFIGTPYYMSPELFANKPYNAKTDIWSLGCCLHEMMTLKYAFPAPNLPALMKIIAKGQIQDLPKRYSKDLKSLCRQLLSPKPSQRPCANKVLRMPLVLTHIRRFITENRNSTQPIPETTEPEVSAESAAAENNTSGSTEQVEGSPLSRTARKKKRFLKDRALAKCTEPMSGDQSPPKPGKRKPKSKQPIRHRPLPIPPISGQGEPAHRKEVRRVPQGADNHSDSSSSCSNRPGSSTSASSLEEIKVDKEGECTLRNSTNFHARRKRREKNSKALSSSVEMIRLQGTLTPRLSPPQTLQEGLTPTAPTLEGSTVIAPTAPTLDTIDSPSLNTCFHPAFREAQVPAGSGISEEETMISLMSETLIAEREESPPLYPQAEMNDLSAGYHGDHTTFSQNWIANIPDAEPPDIHVSRTERFRNLQEECSQAIGPTLFHLACQIIESGDEDTMEMQLLNLLGSEKYDEYALKIWQLKFMGDKMDRSPTFSDNMSDRQTLIFS